MPDSKLTSRVLPLLLALALFVACGGSGRTPVVVYSPHGGAQLKAFKERFEAAYPQYELQPLDLASQAVLDRLRAEKGNPQCDLWWGASAVTFAQGADEGLLEPYKPTWAAAIPEDSRDPQDRWYGIYSTPAVIAYNSDAVSAADAPADWDDLLDPKWRGKILIRDPNPSDTMRTFFGAIILREWAKTNSPEAGYAWLRRLAENTKDYPTNWDLLLTGLNRREGELTVWSMPDVRRAIDEKGYHLAIVSPKSGSPVITDGIAIVKGSPHAEGARALYEFVNTPENLAYAAASFYRIPTRKDVDPSRLPEWMRAGDAPRMSIDWERFRGGIQDWMKHWSAEIRGASNGK